MSKKNDAGKSNGESAQTEPLIKIVPREEAKSPTLSSKALIITSVIDAWEKRYVSTFDVTGAYLHADLPKHKFALLKLRGKFVDIMCDVNPEYRLYYGMNAM